MKDYADKHYKGNNLLFKPGCGYDHMHAEMYAVWYYLNKGLNPGEHIKSMGVSKPICPDCQRVLNHLAINYNKRWTTTERSDHWKDPWRHLSKETVLAVPHWDPALAIPPAGEASFVGVRTTTQPTILRLIDFFAIDQ